MKILPISTIIGLLFISFVSCKKENVVYPTAALADFSILKDEYNVLEEIQFTDNSVPEPENSIVSWEWDFGTPDIAKSSLQNPKVAYANESTYAVTLTVTDNNGLRSSVSKNVKVTDPANNVRIEWSNPLADAIQNTVSPALSPDEKTVYMIADRANDNGDLKLFAYDAESGTEKWGFNIDQALAALNPGGNPRIVYCSPSVGEDGTVYIAVRDLQSPSTNRKSFLFAVSPDGNEKWNYAFGYDVNFNYITVAVGTDGNVYVGGLTNTPYNIVVLNQTNGADLKKIELPTGLRTGLAVSKSGQVYYASTGANGIFSYSLSSSTQVFNYVPDGLGSTGGAFSIGADGVVYTTATIGGNGGVLAINPDGSEKWVYKTSGPIDFGGVVIGENNTLYASGGSTVGSPEKSDGIVALNSDGTLKWKFEIEEPVNNCTPLVDNRGYVHFVTDLGTYYVVKDDGTLYGSISLGVKSNSSPVMDAGGIVYIGAESEDGVSEILRINTKATGPANSAWPMRGQNSRRAHIQK